MPDDSYNPLRFPPMHSLEAAKAMVRDLFDCLDSDQFPQNNNKPATAKASATTTNE